MIMFPVMLASPEAHELSRDFPRSPQPFTYSIDQCVFEIINTKRNVENQVKLCISVPVGDQTP